MPPATPETTPGNQKVTWVQVHEMWPPSRTPIRPIHALCPALTHHLCTCLPCPLCVFCMVMHHLWHASNLWLQSLDTEKNMHHKRASSGLSKFQDAFTSCSRGVWIASEMGIFVKYHLGTIFCSQAYFKKTVKEMMLGFPKSLLNDGHQRGTMVVVNF